MVRRSLTAGPLKILTLSSCQPPKTVMVLRSFIGAYKVLSHVISNCSNFLCPLDEFTAVKESQAVVEWSEHLQEAFTNAQRQLTSAKTIHMPRPTHQFWVVTDGLVKQHSISALMYAERREKLLLCGHFSARLHGHQPSWLPCEVKVFAIAEAIRHSGLTLSSQNTTWLSSPTAYEKLSWSVLSQP